MAIRLIKRERPSPDAMTLAEHLGELRRRLVISAIAFVIAGTFAAIFYNQMLHWLQRPYCQINPRNCFLYVTSPLDGLSLRVKMAAFGGLVLASPVILFQVWRFITPGLRTREKQYAIPFVLAAVVLFVAGCAVAYLTLPHALGFLKAVGGEQLKLIYNPISYLGLVLVMMLLFGLTFEFPVVLVALQLVRVVTPAQLLHFWRYSVIGITLVAAIFTPSSDPFSMLALALPLVVFYFLAIGIGKLLGR
ncbi:MAG TPA: twin-arginine translocase subunit TatC [Acidimicrobiales bacterium]|nr:twin-arginine translocase subunit TatC [Acidimicrobiales bacterium]